MPTLSVNNYDIYYEEHGDGDPLLLIAGLGSSCSMWWKQIDSLGKRYRVITPDHRGIGYSTEVHHPFSIEDLADDMAGLIRGLNIAPSNVLGVSMGGFIALTLTLRCPDIVNKLILVSTSAGGSTHVPSTEEILEIILNGDQSDVGAYCRMLYPALAGPGRMQSQPDDLNHIIGNALEKPLSPEAYLYQLMAVDAYASANTTADALEKIRKPTLVLHGEADPLVPYPNGRHLADHIKDAAMISYPDVGHILPIEAADQFNRDVMNFLG